VLAGTRELQGKALSVLLNSSEPESAVHGQRRNEIAVDINDQATLTARLKNKVIGKKLRSSATTAMIEQVVSRSVPVRGESEIIRVFSRPMHVVCHENLAAYRCSVGGAIRQLSTLQVSSIYEIVSPDSWRFRVSIRLDRCSPRFQTLRPSA
jgi:hypothetical protein